MLCPFGEKLPAIFPFTRTLSRLENPISRVDVIDKYRSRYINFAVKSDNYQSTMLSQAKERVHAKKYIK